MNRVSFRVTAGLWVALCMGAAVEAAAQTPAACAAGDARRGDLGVSSFDCDCVYYIGGEGEGEAPWWIFMSEPVIRGVREGSSASGKLRAGDVVTAIDGLLITTRAAGRRWANPTPGEPVTLTVRRDGRIEKVEIVPRSECVGETLTVEVSTPETTRVITTPAPAATPWVAVTPQPESTPVVVTAPNVEAVVAAPIGVPIQSLPFPEGWFGFGISCNCEIHPESAGGPRVWRFRESPEIFSVEPDSPAEDAGLRRGDVLLQIDGVELVDDEGGRRFGAVKAGDRVVFTYRRGGSIRTVTMTAEERARSAGYSIELSGENLARAKELARELREGAEARSRYADMIRSYVRDTLLISAENRARLRELERNSDVQWKVQRELSELLASLAYTRAVGRAGALDRLRYVGTVGDASVEVRGEGSVIINVLEEGREVEVIAGDARIRIRMED